MSILSPVNIITKTNHIINYIEDNIYKKNILCYNKLGDKMDLKIGVSNRHVHLKQEDLNVLFGNNFTLEFDRDLSQADEFASKQFLTIKTLKDEIKNVRVLGPIRDYTQIEVSKTDAYKLGINPPIRNSEDLVGSCPITLIGPAGTLELNEGCIIATRHIHLNQSEADALGLANMETISVRVNGIKGGILDNVYLKIDEHYTLEMHLDTDDANAHLVNNGDLGLIIKDENKL